MDQLAEAIYALGQRDWFDYLAAFAPLGLSIVAIWISIATARKQNKIALFEIRYNALFQLKTILEFDNLIQGKPSSKIIAFFFDAHFGTDILHCNSTEGINIVIVTVNRLEKDILSRVVVRKKSERDEVLKIILALRDLMLDVVNDKYDKKKKRKLHRLCTAFLNGTFEKLGKRARI